MSRKIPTPEWGNTLHCIGDLHMGDPALTANRQNLVKRDVASLNNPAYRLQLGDLTDNGTPTEDANALAFMQALDGGTGTSLLTAGNHDQWTPRTSTQALTAWSMPDKNYTVDIGFATVVQLGSDQMDADKIGLQYNSTTLNWLSNILAAATKPVIVATHAALGGTEKKLSTLPNFQVQPDANVKAMLAQHTATKQIAWVSGHTHSSPDTYDIVTAAPIGDGYVLAINTGALSHFRSKRLWTDVLVTYFLSVFEDRWEVRLRDHGSRQWAGVGPDKKMVMTFPF